MAAATATRRRLPRWCMPAGLAIALGLAAPMASARAGETPEATSGQDNGALVRAAFEAWRTGQGSLFDLLADDVVWTVAGDSPISGTYRSKQVFMDESVGPITAHLATPIIPKVTRIVADGDHVVVMWEGTATTRAGGTYRNHYAWYMQLANDRIVRVTAFLDTWVLVQLVEAG